MEENFRAAGRKIHVWTKSFVYTVIGGILFWKPYVMHMHGRWIRGLRTDDTSVGKPIKISLLADGIGRELH